MEEKNRGSDQNQDSGNRPRMGRQGHTKGWLFLSNLGKPLGSVQRKLGHAPTPNPEVTGTLGRGLCWRSLNIAPVCARGPRL